MTRSERWASGGFLLVISGLIIAPIMRVLSAIFMGNELALRQEEFDRTILQPLEQHRQAHLDVIKNLRHIHRLN